MKKCATNATNVAHLCHKVWDLYHKVWHINYKNVPQIVGGEKMCHIVALVWEKAGFRGHTTSYPEKVCW